MLEMNYVPRHSITSLLLLLLVTFPHVIMILCSRLPTFLAFIEKLGQGYIAPSLDPWRKREGLLSTACACAKLPQKTGNPLMFSVY